MPDPNSATPGQRRAAWLLAPGARYHLMASALFVVVFAIIPFSIYAHTGEDWSFRFHRLLWLPALGAALCASAWLLIRLSAALSRKLAVALACLLFCLGLFALLAQVYTPIQVGPLDGAALESDEPLWRRAAADPRGAEVDRPEAHPERVRHPGQRLPHRARLDAQRRVPGSARAHRLGRGVRGFRSVQEQHLQLRHDDPVLGQLS